MSHSGSTYTQLLGCFFFCNDFKPDHNAIAGVGHKTVKLLTAITFNRIVCGLITNSISSTLCNPPAERIT